MAIAGSLTYDTKIDRAGFNKGLKEIENSTKNSGTKIKDIVTALGIDKIVSTTMNTLKSSISSAMERIDTKSSPDKNFNNRGFPPVPCFTSFLQVA